MDLTLRTGFVLAVIVATKKYGIWESSEETQELYDSAVTRIKPFAIQASDYLNIYVPDLPPERKSSFLGIYYYNQAVKTITEFLTIFPTYTQVVIEKVPNLFNKLREKYEKQMKENEEKKEKEARKQIIDDKQLVQPLQPLPDPDPECKCSKKLKESTPGLMPKDAPPSPYKDHCSKSSVVKPPCGKTEKICKCPKCAKKEGCVVKSKCPRKDCKKCMRREGNLNKESSLDAKPTH